MGTDIHMYVEKKVADIGPWKYVRIEVWDDRCYDVFAMLANVRNGYGFAGIPTGRGFKVLADPRGEPADLSEYVREHHSWDHTQSWLLLREIVDAEASGYFEQTTSHVGVIPLAGDSAILSWAGEDSDNYLKWVERGRGQPRSWSGEVMGRDIRTVTEPEAKLLVANGYKGPTKDEPLTYYVRVEWTSTYRDSAEYFLRWVHDKLVPYCERELGGDTSKLRIVFGFDS